MNHTWGRSQPLLWQTEKPNTQLETMWRRVTLTCSHFKGTYKRQGTGLGVLPCVAAAAPSRHPQHELLAGRLQRPAPGLGSGTMSSGGTWRYGVWVTRGSRVWQGSFQAEGLQPMRRSGGVSGRSGESCLPPCFSPSIMKGVKMAAADTGPLLQLPWALLHRSSHAQGHPPPYSDALQGPGSQDLQPLRQKFNISKFFLRGFWHFG